MCLWYAICSKHRMHMFILLYKVVLSCTNGERMTGKSCLLSGKLEVGGVFMKEKITLCGDNCFECPRYNAHTDEELKAVAELWYKVGWKECVVSNEEIACSGCSSHKQCTYQLVECTRERGVYKCNQCNEFPCGKINAMLKRSAEYKKKCEEVCSEQEYIILEKAFFEKENNLKK